MADVDGRDASGFKLFGTMIPVQAIQVKQEEGIESKSSGQTSARRTGKCLPCPRCKSMETKFCYFNNYNVNQPRHFCKGCQRYWTAGGTLRNVPLGAGRRKVRSACQEPIGFSANSSFDSTDVLEELRLEGVMEQWNQISASRALKRRNSNGSAGQIHGISSLPLN